MSGSSSTPTCPRRSKPTIRKSAAPAATACPPTRSRSTARATSNSGGARFSTAARPRNASGSKWPSSTTSWRCAKPRAAGAKRFWACSARSSGPCGHCDVCEGAVRLIDGRIEAQKALSAILRTSGRFFFGHLANILSGKATEAIERHGHDELKTFGVGKDRTPADWRGVLRQLQSGGLIERDWNDRDRLTLTEEGRRVLRGEAPFALREDVVNGRARRRSRAAAAPNDADADLLAALKALRGAIAAAQKQPAYVIFPDRTLIEMAKERPRGLDELAGIHGVGAVKLQKYGSAFLAVIRDRAHA